MRYIDSTHGRGKNGWMRIGKGTLHGACVCVSACLVTCMRYAGFTKLAPGSMVRDAVEEVTWLSCEPCVSACRERLYCGTEATQDVPCIAGVGKVERASERRSILPVRVLS